MMSSGPEVLLPVDALLVNRGTVKSRRKAWDVDNFGALAALAADCLEAFAGTCQGPPEPGRCRPAE